MEVDAAPMNFDMFNRMRVLYRGMDCFYWVIPGTDRVMQLPDPERTDLTDEDNWKILLRPGDLLLDQVKRGGDPMPDNANEGNVEMMDAAEGDPAGYEGDYHGGPTYQPPGPSSSGYAQYGAPYDPMMSEIRQMHQESMDSHNSLMGRVDRLEIRMDEQFTSLYARFDAWNPYGWQHNFPPPPPPDQ